MEKLDLKKELKHLYSTKTKPEIINVPELNYLRYKGRGEPGGIAYMESINALYAISYTLKFKIKKEKFVDYPVMPLEGLWWWDTPGIVNLDEAPPRETWNWISLILTPKIVTTDMLEKVNTEVAQKKGDYVKKVELKVLNDGICVQILHIGPYSEENRSQKILSEYIKKEGYSLRGHHHEVYLNNPQRTAPNKIKTLLRHPVEKT